jgi:hypothetical protein
MSVLKKIISSGYLEAEHKSSFEWWKSSSCVKFQINNHIDFGLNNSWQTICASEHEYGALRKNNYHIDNSTIGIWQIENDV